MASMTSITTTPSPKQQTDNKKIRTTFSDNQKQALEIYFQRNPYPDPRETEELSQSLGLGEAVIKVWFQNKRSRDKQRKFSHANRAAMRENMKAETATNSVKAASLYASPIFNNIQMLTSRLNNYQTAFSAIQNRNSLYY